MTQHVGAADGADLANNPLFFKSHHRAAGHNSEIELVLDIDRQICAVRLDGESYSCSAVFSLAALQLAKSRCTL